MKQKIPVCVVVVALMSGGCASVGTRLGHDLTGSPRKLGVYPGVRADLKAAPLILPLADLPLSFLADSVALPGDIDHAKHE